MSSRFFSPIFGYIDHKNRIILAIFNFTDESVLTFIYSYDTVSLWYVTIFIESARNLCMPQTAISKVRKERNQANNSNSNSISQGLVSDYSTSAVPVNQRKSFTSNAAVWFGFAVSISAFLTGGTLGAGLTAANGIAAVLIGNSVLVVIAVLLGIIGQRTGLTTAHLGRIVFGKKGSIISSVVLGTLGMCLIGVLMDSFGTSIAALLPGFPSFLAIVIFAVCITSSAIFGYKGLTIISYVAVPSLLLLLLISLISCNGIVEGGLGAVFDIQPAGELTMAAGISSVISTWPTGLPVCRYFRYAKKPSHIVGSVIFGFIVGTSVFEGSAVIMSIATDATDFTAFSMPWAC